jgi:hypothetical protein
MAVRTVMAHTTDCLGFMVKHRYPTAGYATNIERRCRRTSIFTVYRTADPSLESLHHEDLVNVAGVSETYAAYIFRVNVSRVGVCLYVYRF